MTKNNYISTFFQFKIKKMEKIFISLGCQCSTTVLFERLGVKRETLPFDWMFSTPHFVYSILKMLLIDNVHIDEIVDNEFFRCDKRAILKECEHHVTDETGNILLNSKYNVCFPHDEIGDREKYKRRLLRLKELILNNNIFIFFMYISPSSNTIGNYTLDGVEPIQQLYDYMDKINNIIKTVRSNYKIIILDTSKPDDILPSDSIHMIYKYITPKHNWADMLPEIVDKLYKPSGL